LIYHLLLHVGWLPYFGTATVEQVPLLLLTSWPDLETVTAS
jgi:hypothetical protein